MSRPPSTIKRQIRDLSNWHYIQSAYIDTHDQLWLITLCGSLVQDTAMEAAIKPGAHLCGLCERLSSARRIMRDADLRAVVEPMPKGTVR